METTSPVLPSGEVSPVPTPDMSVFEERHFSERRMDVQTPHCPEPPLKSQSVSRLFSRKRQLYTPATHHVQTPASYAYGESDAHNVSTSSEASFQTSPVRWEGGSSFFEDNFDHFGLLGQGSFADVFRVRSRRDGIFYAVKKARRPFRGTKDRKRAMQEVEVAAELSCGNHIVTQYGAWEEEGYLFIQTECCDEGTLRQLINQRAHRGRIVSDMEVWEFMVDIALGLKDMHFNCLIHLDIKPDNLFLKNGRILIGDFGIAYKVGSGESLDLEGDGVYLPAELLVSSIPTFEADIFSMGATLFELLSNIEMPSGGFLWNELRHGRVPVPKSRDPELVKMVKAMMSFEPCDRPTIRDILTHPEVQRRLAQRPDEGPLVFHDSVCRDMLFTSTKEQGGRQSRVSDSDEFTGEDFSEDLGLEDGLAPKPKNLMNMFGDMT